MSGVAITWSLYGTEYWCLP